MKDGMSGHHMQEVNPISQKAVKKNSDNLSLHTAVRAGVCAAPAALFSIIIDRDVLVFSSS